MSFHKMCDVGHDVVLWYVSDVALNSYWTFYVVLLAVNNVVSHHSS